MSDSKPEAGARSGAGDRPFVTVVMPVRNEAEFIRRSLGSVLAQEYPSDRMEVLVADGMSTDGTREILSDEQARHSNLRLLDNPGRIVACGLNAAIAESRGEIVVRVDGHCELPPDYVSRCVEHLSNGADCVGGWVETVGQNSLSKAIAAAMSSRFGVGGSDFRTVRDRTMEANTVPFPGFRREVLERAGRFDEELVRNQDDEYSYRLRKLGAKVILAADIHSLYFSRSSYRSLASQYLQYGYWKVRVVQKHPRQMRLGQYAPAAFVLTIIAALALTPVAGFWPLLALGLTYGTANFGAAVMVSNRQGWDIFPFLPLAFFLLHFCYGAGFLAGLVTFCSRWSDSSRRRAASIVDSKEASRV
ncbi:MAG TPA: glycosyltransferase family 2 protein [Verrucomicrobiae bacterium]|nr:glycosyltransferase family 2 protein [Verrucomicrobiae bacterium]